MNRRDAIVALMASVGTTAIFVFVADMVRSPIDNRKNFISQTEWLLARTEEEKVFKTRIKRNEEGRPFVESSDGDWMLVKASSREAGLLYLRDRFGRVFKLAVADRIQACF